MSQPPPPAPTPAPKAKFAISSDISPARATMLLALLLMFVSQFLYYKGAERGSMYMDFYGYSTRNVRVGYVNPGATGWEMHPYASYILIALGVLFITDLHQEPVLKRAAYWISLAASFFFLFRWSGGGVVGGGTWLGFAALALMGVAIFLNARTLQGEKAAAVTTTNLPPTT